MISFFSTEVASDEWDYELNTVHPDDLIDLALRVHQNYPNKRLIIHFMQPHEPHLGSKANQIRERVDLRGYDIFHANNNVELDREGINMWMAARQGQVSDSEIQKSYRQTLEFVLEKVKRLLDELSGKSIITADHGEMLGERVLHIKKEYGHPTGLKTRELREIPWFVAPYEDRRKVTSDEPVGFERLDEDKINQRLRALGYKS